MILAELTPARTPLISAITRGRYYDEVECRHRFCTSKHNWGVRRLVRYTLLGTLAAGLLIAGSFFALRPAAAGRSEPKLRLALATPGEAIPKLIDTTSLPSNFHLMALPFWSGTRFILWGSDQDCPENREVPASAFAFDPETQLFEALALKNAPSARSSPIFSMDGDNLTVWGGFRNAAPSKCGFDPIEELVYFLVVRSEYFENLMRRFNPGIFTTEDPQTFYVPQAVRYNFHTKRWQQPVPLQPLIDAANSADAAESAAFFWPGQEIETVQNGFLIWFHHSEAPQYEIPSFGPVLIDHELISEPQLLPIPDNNLEQNYFSPPIWADPYYILYYPMRTVSDEDLEVFRREKADWDEQMKDWPPDTGEPAVPYELSLPFESSQGSIFDLETRSWKKISTSAAPSPRELPVVEWVAGRLVVWGGFAGTKQSWDDAERGPAVFDGAIYDVQRQTWIKMSDVGAPHIENPVAGVVGDKLIVMARPAHDENEPGRPKTKIAAIFDPTRNRWEKYSDVAEQLSGMTLIKDWYFGWSASWDYLEWTPRRGGSAIELQSGAAGLVGPQITIGGDFVLLSEG